MVNGSALATALKTMTRPPETSYWDNIKTGLPSSQVGPVSGKNGNLETVISIGGPSIRRGGTIVQYAHNGFIGKVAGITS